MRVVIVYNLDIATDFGDSQDIVAIQDTDHTANSILSALIQCGYNASIISVSSSLDELNQKLSPYDPNDTFVFHNCDGFLGRSLGAVDLVGAIEQLGFAHTASHPPAILTSTDKRLAKRLLTEANIPTPAYQICESTHDKIIVPCPVIIKPATEEASLGITVDSVARTPDAISRLIQHILADYHQPALVEQFISGRELACAVLGNDDEAVVLPLSEMDYSEISDPMARLLTYESKWIEGTFYHDNIGVLCPAPMDPIELKHVEKAALQAGKALQLRDFYRLDIRLENGIPYVLDVNDLPDLAPESGFARSALAAGYTYSGMIDAIVKIAMKREGWNG
jgi:D-alanine-D-alanine ligase